MIPLLPLTWAEGFNTRIHQESIIITASYCSLACRFGPKLVRKLLNIIFLAKLVTI
jgi:hypothetical protein